MHERIISVWILVAIKATSEPSEHNSTSNEWFYSWTLLYVKFVFQTRISHGWGHFHKTWQVCCTCKFASPFVHPLNAQYFSLVISRMNFWNQSIRKHNPSARCNDICLHMAATTTYHFCWHSGVGVTKTISSVPLISQYFILAKTHFNC